MKNIISRRKIKKTLTLRLSRLIDILIMKRLQQRAAQLNTKRGMPIAVFGNDWIGININVNGLYEQEELEDLAVLLKNTGVDTRNSTVIDVGANIGNHAIEFSKYFSSVICFEPNPRTFDILAANTKNINNIFRFNWGCSSFTKTIKLNEDFNNLGGSSAIIASASSNTVDILVKPLDEMIDSLESVALMKIDVEGMEIEVLKGADLIISKFHPIIILEQHELEFGEKFYETESLDYLRSKGYRIFCLDKLRTSNSLLRFFNDMKKFLFGDESDREIIEYKKLPKSKYSMIFALHASAL